MLLKAGIVFNKHCAILKRANSLCNPPKINLKDFQDKDSIEEFLFLNHAVPSMDKFTALAIAFVAAIIAIAAAIVYYFGFVFLLRLALGICYALFAILLAVVFGILVYAKSRYALLALIGLIPAAYAAWQCYEWSQPLHVGYITAGYILAAVLGLWWLAEPDMSITERLRSAASLEKAGKFRSAARKYEKKGNYGKAAE